MAKEENKVTGWYADLLWIEGLIAKVEDEFEVTSDIVDQIRYCRKRMKRLKSSMMREGMKGVTEAQIMSSFTARTPTKFKFNSGDEREEK